MFLQLFLVISLGVIYVAGNCGPPVPVAPHYEEWGCTPHIEGPCNTAGRFTCPDWNTWDKTKCHYKGKLYNVGESLDTIEGDPCLRDCTCTLRDNDELPSFNCANVECPEYLRQASQPNCIGQYSKDECCIQKQLCDAEKEALPRCSNKGKTYYKNQRITSDHYLDNCYTCLCDENFSNSTELLSNSKSCKKINCGLELRHLKEAQKGCAPIYLREKACCPISWKCPSDDDKIKNPEYPGDGKLTCKFGRLTLSRYQEIDTKDKCVTCICRQPPFLTCTHELDCYNR